MLIFESDVATRDSYWGCHLQKVYVRISRQQVVCDWGAWGANLLCNLLIRWLRVRTEQNTEWGIPVNGFLFRQEVDKWLIYKNQKNSWEELIEKEYFPTTSSKKNDFLNMFDENQQVMIIAYRDGKLQWFQPNIDSFHWRLSYAHSYIASP